MPYFFRRDIFNGFRVILVWVEACLKIKTALFPKKTFARHCRFHACTLCASCWFINKLWAIYFSNRNNQSLKGATVVTHCQNEAEVKFQMDIDQQIRLTITNAKLIWNCTSASFWQRVTTTAPFNIWDNWYTCSFMESSPKYLFSSRGGGCEMIMNDCHFVLDELPANSST